MKKMSYKNDEKAGKGQNIKPGQAYQVTDSFTDVGTTERQPSPTKASDSYPQKSGK